MLKIGARSKNTRKSAKIFLNFYRVCLKSKGKPKRKVVVKKLVQVVMLQPRSLVNMTLWKPPTISTQIVSIYTSVMTRVEVSIYAKLPFTPLALPSNKISGSQNKTESVFQDMTAR